jgi:hypothetical protein
MMSEEYNEQRDKLYIGLQNNIAAFKELVKDSPEVLKFFDDLLEKTMSASYPNPYADSNKDGKKQAEKDAKAYADKQKKLLLDISKYAADAAAEYSKTALENKKNDLNAELDAIKNKFKIEEEILKSNLDNQLITESQYRAKSEELRKKQLQKENQVNEEIFKAEKKADSANVIIETLEALASNAINNYKSTDTVSATALTAAGYAAITASGVAKLDAIRRRQFYPVKFEDGGIVEGPSHAQGGVPFTVNGQGGYEMEGGEFIVNKKAASLHRQLLESINNSAKRTTSANEICYRWYSYK